MFAQDRSMELGYRAEGRVQTSQNFVTKSEMTTVSIPVKQC